MGSSILEEWPQWIGGLAAALLVFQTGVLFNWPSPMLPKLTKPGSPVPMTMDEASWMVSLLNLTRPVGALIGSLCAQIFGSKMTCFLATIPFALSWILTILAGSPEWLYVARSFGGVGCGMIFVTHPIYLGEISSAKSRGALVSLGHAAKSTGTLLIMCIGPYLSLEVSTEILLVPLIIAMILLLYLPESPHHLVKVGKPSAAAASISWYNRDGNVDEQLEDLTNFVNSARDNTFWRSVQEVFLPPYRQAIIIASMLCIFLQITGGVNVAAYMQTILESAKIDIVDPPIVVIITMVGGVIASCVSMYLFDIWGRKIMLVLSCVGSGLAMVPPGVYFLYMNWNYDVNDYQWVVILCFCLLIFSMNAGMLSVSMIVLSELFPPHLKCASVLIANIVLGLSAFASIKLYQPMVEELEESYTLFIYAALNLACVPYVVVCMPETKGKSLQEIQQKLNRRHGK